MSDTFITIIGIFIIAILLFIVPVMATANQNDTITQTQVQAAVSDFVDTSTKQGQITQENYDKLIQKLYATGNSYDISMEVQKLSSNPMDKKGRAIGENIYYSVYKNDILKALETGPYLLKQGEYVKVEVKNTNITVGTNLKNYVYSIIGKDTTAIEASKSGLVLVELKQKKGNILAIIPTTTPTPTTKPTPTTTPTPTFIPIPIVTPTPTTTPIPTVTPTPTTTPIPLPIPSYFPPGDPEPPSDNWGKCRYSDGCWTSEPATSGANNLPYYCKYCHTECVAYYCTKHTFYSDGSTVLSYTVLCPACEGPLDYRGQCHSEVWISNPGSELCHDIY